MKRLKAKLKTKIFEAKYIIDIGCSSGSLLNIEFNSKSVVVGIDNCFGRLKNNKNYKYKIVADIYNFPFKKVKFDFVILKYVMEHLDKPEIAVSNISFLLKNKCCLYAAVPKYYAFQDSLYRFLGRMAELLNKGKQAHIQKFTFAGFLDIFYKNNFLLLDFAEVSAGLSFLDKTKNRRIFKKIVLKFIEYFKKIFNKDLLERNEMHFLFTKIK